MTIEIGALKAELAALRQDGVAIPQPGESVGEVLSRADQVMYAAKGRSLRSSRR